MAGPVQDLRWLENGDSALQQAIKDAVNAAGAGGSTGLPALTLGTTNAAGTGTVGVSINATIAAFDTTAPVTQAFGDTAATGSAGVAARRDHKHGIPANPILGSAYETTLADTSLDTILTVTPAVAGLYLVRIYFRVITASTTTTIQVLYTDKTGAQTATLVNAVSEATGSYSLVPFVVASDSSTIIVKAQAGTANQLIVSASITS